MTKYLVVCRANLYRSPFAARWLLNHCRQNNIDAEIKSAGLVVDYMPDEECNLGYRRVQLTREFIEWADRTFVMQKYMRDAIIESYGPFARQPDIVNLEIADKFYREIADDVPDDMDPQEASKLLEDPYRIFGPVLFSKVLEARMAPHVVITSARR